MHKRHTERCAECKRRIAQLLEAAYGAVKERHSLGLGARLEDHRGKACYPHLRRIHRKLQHHRGFRSFVRSNQLPAVDYFVPNPKPGLVVELDESQHFTKPRQIALQNYPPGVKPGFDRMAWIERCARLNRKDNDPPYRDEQRAWYDTLRDFGCAELGIPLVRLLPTEVWWCDLNPRNKGDVQWFRKFLDAKLATCRGNNRPQAPFRIGLAFPKIGHTLKDFVPGLRRDGSTLDLLVFPEHFEQVRVEGRTCPRRVETDGNVQRLERKYRSRAEKLSLAIVVGFGVGYGKGEKDDEYSLLVRPGEKPVFYHKHSSSLNTAFFDDRWSVQDNLPVARVKGRKVGLSLCHDMYISLIPMALRRKGADVWVNLSYSNVRSHIWQSMLQTRAFENDMLAVCTLHRGKGNKKGGRGRPQSEPYAFAPGGKITLYELGTQRALHTLPESRRAGKVFWFDAANYEVNTPGTPGPGDLSTNAHRLTLRRRGSGPVRLDPDDGRFRLESIGLKTFLYRPDALWKLALSEPGRMPLFIVAVRGRRQWEANEHSVLQVIRGRVIEFSTVFAFAESAGSTVFMAAYRSSSYKDARVFYPGIFPVVVDTRYLMGLNSTYEISDDRRGKPRDLYLDRVTKLVTFLQRSGPQRQSSAGCR